MTRLTRSDAWSSALLSSAKLGTGNRCSPASVALIFAESGADGECGHRWLLAESVWTGLVGPTGVQKEAKWLLRLIGRVLKGPWVILWNRLFRNNPHLNSCHTVSASLRDDQHGNIIRWTIRNISLVKDSLVSLFGDCLAGHHDSKAGDVLLDTVHADLMWLSGRCRRIAVIAHSLGAAITADALATRRLPDNLALLVTYGASLPKRHRLFGDSLCEKIGLLEALDKSIRWIDFAADRDLFAGSPVPRTVRINIRNEQSIFTDHWAYWRNTEEFITPVIEALVQAESSPRRISIRGDRAGVG